MVAIRTETSAKEGSEQCGHYCLWDLTKGSLDAVHEPVTGILPPCYELLKSL